MPNILYLVTGCAGFLGSTVCRQLLERGDAVRGFALSGDPAISQLPKDVELIQGDLCCIEDVERFFTVPAGTETVCLHIASVISISPEYSNLVMNVNVGSTQNIIRCCLKHQECKKLVYCSSTGAIPAAEREKKIREIMYFDPNQAVGCYSRSKAIATQAILDAAYYHGLNACVIHPAGIFGPGDPAHGETTNLVLSIIHGKIPVAIDGAFNMIDVRDLAAGTITAAEKGRSGECYILSNDIVTFKRLADLLHRETNCKRIKHFLRPKTAYRLASMMEKLAGKNSKKNLLTTFSVYNLVKNNNFDCAKAKKELGFSARPYEATIHDMICWLKSTGKL